MILTDGRPPTPTPCDFRRRVRETPRLEVQGIRVRIVSPGEAGPGVDGELGHGDVGVVAEWWRVAEEGVRGYEGSGVEYVQCLVRAVRRWEDVKHAQVPSCTRNRAEVVRFARAYGFTPRKQSTAEVALLQPVAASIGSAATATSSEMV
ncbi:hypothetical protein KC338_g98 [Hortaea werneckii]|nr:hypothetical protein KC338_g98 [Hortaea werneckii]